MPSVQAPSRHNGKLLAGSGTRAIAGAGDGACSRLYNGGHLSIRKTVDRILNNFYWPAIHTDVSRFVGLVIFVREQHGRDLFRGLLFRVCP